MAGHLNLTTKTQKSYEDKIKASPPIIVIIMDEFALWALLDQEGTIDPVRFPNLSAFAKDSTWFRNARSVVPVTVYALPVITTGRATQLEPYLPPKLDSFPENMFSWLEKHYDRFNIIEFSTALAPNRLRENEFNFKQYLSDLLFFSYYFYLLKIDVGNLEAKIPSRWCGFAAPQELNLSAWCDRLQGGKTLNFLHMKIPHSPLKYNFDGVKYRRNSLCQTIKNEQVKPQVEQFDQSGATPLYVAMRLCRRLRRPDHDLLKKEKHLRFRTDNNPGRPRFNLLAGTAAAWRAVIIRHGARRIYTIADQTAISKTGEYFGSPGHIAGYYADHLRRTADSAAMADGRQ